MLNEMEIDVNWESRFEDINKYVFKDKLKDLNFLEVNENVYIYNSLLHTNKSLILRYYKTYIEIQYVHQINKITRNAITFERIESYEAFEKAFNFILEFKTSYDF